MESEKNLEDMPMSICEKNSEFKSTAMKQALLNDLILDHVISFLGFESLLNFRLVCHRWCSFSAKAFWNKSRINYQVLEKISPLQWTDFTWPAVNYKNEEKIEMFKDAFPQTELPTSIVKFQGYANQYALHEILFVKGSTSIKEIYFKCMYHRTSKMMVHNLTPYLGPMISKLDIRDSLGTWFIVPLKKLVNVKYLHLDVSCSVVFNGKISPKELSINVLKQMLIHNREKILDVNGRANRGRILINEFVDFSQINKLYLKGSVFKIDMTESNAKFEVLELTGGIIVEGWGKTSWETNALRMDAVCFMSSKYEMLKSIVKIPDSNVDLDLTSLPWSIERLHFRRHKFMPELTFMYPNLTYAYVNQYFFRGESQSQTVDFTRCENLKSFELYYLMPRANDKQNLDVIRLPSSVRKMKIHGADILSSKIYHLDTLVLKGYPITLAETVVTHFQTSTLVVDYKEDLLHDEEKLAVINFWKAATIPVFALKGFKWTEINSFKGSEFSKYVDAESSCYLFFIGEPGKAISSQHFDKLCTI